MTIPTEEAEQLASRHNKESHAWASDGANHDLAQFHAQSAAALFYLAAERDALQARVAELEARLRDARAKYIELNDKDAVEAMVKIIAEALRDVE